MVKGLTEKTIKGYGGSLYVGSKNIEELVLFDLRSTWLSLSTSYCITCAHQNYDPFTSSTSHIKLDYFKFNVISFPD